MRISKSLRAFGILALISPSTSHFRSIVKPQYGNQPLRQFSRKRFPERATPMQDLPLYYLDLDLSEAQQDKIIALIHLKIPQIWKMERKRHQLLDELRKLSSDGAFDEAKALQTSDQLAALEEETAFNHAKIDSQICTVLTSEQCKQVLANKPHLPNYFRKSASKYHIQSKPESKGII